MRKIISGIVALAFLGTTSLTPVLAATATSTDFSSEMATKAKKKAVKKKAKKKVAKKKVHKKKVHKKKKHHKKKMKKAAPKAEKKSELFSTDLSAAKKKKKKKAEPKEEKKSSIILYRIAA